ncbi:MAG: TolC family protein [Elainellaceae cyanobacterium]
MQPSYSFIAISIGAVIAISPCEAAASHTVFSLHSSSESAHDDDRQNYQNYQINSAPSFEDEFFVRRLQQTARPTPPSSTIDGIEGIRHEAPRPTGGDRLGIAKQVPSHTELAQASPDGSGSDVDSEPSMDDPAIDSGDEPPSRPITEPQPLPSVEDEVEGEPTVDDLDDELEDDLDPDDDLEAEPDLNDELDPDAEPDTDDLDIDDEPSSDRPFEETLDHLNASPNPLTFPTTPEEVEIIGTQPITLEEAIEVARSNSRELQAAQLQLEQSRASLREAQAARFPSLSAGADLTHQDLNSASDQGDTGDLGSDQFLPLLDETGQTVGTLPLDALTGEGTFDRDDNTTTLSGTVELSYDIFTSGQRRSLIRAAERAVRFQEIQVEIALEELRLNVTNSYYDLQEADENVRIARSTLEESLRSLRDAEARERAGVGTRFDRLQAEVDVANSRQDLRNTIRDQLTARRALVELLSIPPRIDVSAADPVEVAGEWGLTLEESIVLALKNRGELEQQLVQRELNEQQRRAELANVRPQLSAFARYRLQDLLDDTNTSSDFDAFEVGLQVNWLLFDGGAARAAARQEEIDIRLAETEFANTAETVQFEVESAYLDLQANFNNIDTAAIAVDLAEESLRLARLRFQAGVGIQSDVLQAQTDLTEAEVNLVNAVLGYNRALVALQRAVSNLPSGYLNDVP